jgi:hypothetical protein
MMYIQLELCQESLGSMVATTKDPWRELELIGLMKQVGSGEGRHAAVPTGAPFFLARRALAAAAAARSRHARWCHTNARADALHLKRTRVQLLDCRQRRRARRSARGAGADARRAAPPARAAPPQRKTGRWRLRWRTSTPRGWSTWM